MLSWIFLLLSGPLSGASYNTNCMKLLGVPISLPVHQFYKTMIEHVHAQEFAAGLTREHLGPIDYELIYDVTHGLPAIVVFSDGVTVNFNLDRLSLEKLRNKLMTTNALHVIYTAPALDKIRYVLRNICFVRGQSGCDVYNSYIGLMDAKRRPFSLREEQVLKWATVYQLPINITVEVFRDMAISKQEIRDRINDLRLHRLRTAENLLRSIFKPAVADEIFNQFVAEYINDAFDRMMNMTAENVVIFRK